MSYSASAHLLWTTQVNLAPTTDVIAGGVGTCLPAQPAVASILHRDNYKGKRTDAQTSPQTSGFTHVCDKAGCKKEIELHEVPPAVFVAPIVRQDICRIIQSSHLRASHFEFSNNPSLCRNLVGGLFHLRWSCSSRSLLWDLFHTLSDRIQFRPPSWCLTSDAPGEARASTLLRLYFCASGCNPPNHCRLCSVGSAICI